MPATGTKPDENSRQSPIANSQQLTATSVFLIPQKDFLKKPRNA
jgi:hypothetical protein